MCGIWVVSCLKYKNNNYKLYGSIYVSEGPTSKSYDIISNNPDKAQNILLVLGDISGMKTCKAYVPCVIIT